MAMKRNMLFVLFLSVILILTACGGGGKQDTGGTQSSTTSSDTNRSDSSENSTSENKEEEVFKVRIAHSEAATGVYHQGVVKFAELLEEKSNGRFDVETYPAGQLGGQRDLFEGIQMGGIELSVQNPSIASNFVREVEILDLPFIWPNEEVMWQVLDSDASQIMHESMEEIGIRFFGVWAGGFKSITTNGKPILSPADLKGVKFRVTPSPLLLAQYEAWGANPEPIDYGELYNALQMGVVAGQENPLEGIYDMKFYEVQEYLSLTEHSYYSVMSIANLDWFNSLPADLQEVVVEAEREARHFQREMMKQTNEEILEEMKGLLEVVQPTEEQIEEFRVKSQSIYDLYTDTDRKRELFNTIQEAVKAAR